MPQVLGSRQASDSHPTPNRTRVFLTWVQITRMLPRMKVAPRYLEAQLRSDLARKMVFVAGPRQVGKTTLAKRLPGAADGYLSWDVPAHRERILRRELPAADLWVNETQNACITAGSLCSSNCQWYLCC